MISDAGSRASLESAGNGRFRLAGTVGFATVMQLLGESRALFADLPDVTIDFREVEHFNSAGLALLIEWLRWAQRAGRGLRFEHLPGEALAMARICDVEAFLDRALVEEGQRA